MSGGISCLLWRYQLSVVMCRYSIVIWRPLQSVKVMHLTLLAPSQSCCCMSYYCYYDGWATARCSCVAAFVPSLRCCVPVPALQSPLVVSVPRCGCCICTSVVSLCVSCAVPQNIKENISLSPWDIYLSCGMSATLLNNHCLFGWLNPSALQLQLSVSRGIHIVWLIVIFWWK